MPKITTLQNQIHNKCLEYRNLEYLVCSTKFQMAWEAADEEQLKALIASVEEHDTQKVKCRMNTILTTNIESKNVKELRIIASRLGITGANLISKAGLLSLIMKGLDNEKR